MARAKTFHDMPPDAPIRMMARRERNSHRAGPPHVALIIETSSAYGRELLGGVSDFVRENGPWTVYLEPRSLNDPAPAWLKGWDGQGIISRASYPQFARLVQRTGLPTVDLNDQLPETDLPSIQSDHEEISRLAAEHLLERGFVHFAYFGYPVFEWSRRRRDGFARLVRDAGHTFHEYDHPQRASWGHQLPSWEEEMDGVARWLKGLPKPLGLMASNDFRGMQALDACRRAGVAVPEGVAVIGVDNEAIVCDLAHPPLSSVIPDARRVGYEAASLLARLMDGERPGPTRVTVPPRGIATRQSTDVTAIADPSVADALRFIRENACHGIGVEDVLDHVLASRSVLQRSFRKLLGCTIHDAIIGARLQRVKQLLLETELTLPAIADRAGFAYVEYLSAVFRQRTGWTLGAYRREFGNLRGAADTREKFP